MATQQLCCGEHDPIKRGLFRHHLLSDPSHHALAQDEDDLSDRPVTSNTSLLVQARRQGVRRRSSEIHRALWSNPPPAAMSRSPSGILEAEIAGSSGVQPGPQPFYGIQPRKPRRQSSSLATGKHAMISVDLTAVSSSSLHILGMARMSLRRDACLVTFSGGRARLWPLKVCMTVCIADFRCKRSFCCPC